LTLHTEIATILQETCKSSGLRVWSNTYSLTHTHIAND